MKRKNFYFLPFLSVAIVLLLTHPLCAQGTVFFSEPVSISTEGNHALAAMLDHIRHLYSTAIDFEEVPIEYSSDMWISPVLMKSGAHPVAARRGKLTVQLDKNDRTAYQAVETVLAAYTGSGLPGLYQAIDEGERVDVIPIQTRGVTGSMRRVTPIMDSSITLDYQPRGTYKLIQDIAVAISKVSGTTVYMSAIGAPETLSVDTEPSGFSGEKARDALAKIGGFSYQALFDPGERAYYLNIGPATSPPVPTQPTTPKARPSGRPQTSPFWVKK